MRNVSRFSKSWSKPGWWRLLEKFPLDGGLLDNAVARLSPWRQTSQRLRASSEMFGVRSCTWITSAMAAASKRGRSGLGRAQGNTSQTDLRLERLCDSVLLPLFVKSGKVDFLCVFASTVCGVLSPVAACCATATLGVIARATLATKSCHSFRNGECWVMHASETGPGKQQRNKCVSSAGSAIALRKRWSRQRRTCRRTNSEWRWRSWRKRKNNEADVILPRAQLDSAMACVKRAKVQEGR